MSIPTITYQWPLQDEWNLAELSYSKLLFWNDGMLILGYNQQHTTIAIKEYHFEKNISVEDFNNIILDESIWAGEEQLTQILLLSENNLIIPKKFFQIEECTLWFKQLHFVNYNEKIEVSHLRHPAGYIMDSYRADLIANIQNIFPNVPLLGFADYCLASIDTTTYNVGIFAVGNKMALSIFKDDKLLSFNVTDCSPAQIIHLLSLTNLEQKDIHIALFGWTLIIDELQKELSEYFPTTIEKEGIELLNDLALCE